MTDQQLIGIWCCLFEWQSIDKIDQKMEKYSSKSCIIERMKKQMLTDSTFKRRVDRVADRVTKSQERT